VGVALAGAGAVVYGIESRQLDEQVAATAQRSLAEFTQLQHRGDNPATGKPWTSIQQMLRSYLSSNVPGDCDLFIGWAGGKPALTSAGADIHADEVDRLTADPAFLAAASQAIATGRPVDAVTPAYGDLIIDAQRVRQGHHAGALVVVSYLEMDRRELMQTMRTYLLVALLALLFITGVATWQSGRLLSPIRTLRRTADEIGETDLSRRIPVTGNDDLTHLTSTLNGMLGRLESAFVGQRQFLDDAGHELKTPLTVLRGHLELLDHDNPDDVAETRELLMDEVDRMSRLVGDLILIAKSDRPDFLTTGPVDLAPLTETLLAKARGLAPQRDWRLDGTGNGRVVVDEQRITQAVLQLADNAVKHSGNGDPICIGSSYDATGTRLWVRDHGPGVPPADHERIFTRFNRGDTDDRDGIGLGLSIVRAIAEAHGGTAHVEDAAPGARFVVTLPRQAEA
jgi:signal transduction histidine kinase